MRGGGGDERRERTNVVQGESRLSSAPVSTLMVIKGQKFESSTLQTLFSSVHVLVSRPKTLTPDPVCVCVHILLNHINKNSGQEITLISQPCVYCLPAPPPREGCGQMVCLPAIGGETGSDGG